MLKKFITVITLSLLLGLLVACASPTPEPDEITVQLSWFHTAEFAGFYTADQLGYYAEENLVVNLKPGSPAVNPTQKVVSGEAQFGITGGDGILRAHADEHDLVAVASIFRKNPLIVMTLAESDIERPKDLVGKTVGVISADMGTSWDIQFLGMLNNLDIDPESMIFVPIQDFNGANELTSGRMDAASGLFSTNEPVQARLDGVDVSLMFYNNYGVAIYINTIFTTGEMVREHPDLVERFVQATLKGYEYAIEHPEEAAEFPLAYDDTLDTELATASMKAQIPLIDTGDAPIGWMDQGIWRVTHNMLLEQDIITSPIDIDKLYTNQFVEGGAQETEEIEGEGEGE
jgi:NitT/TauT family transport system substrate-binding protein